MATIRVLALVFVLGVFLEIVIAEQTKESPEVIAEHKDKSVDLKEFSKGYVPKEDPTPDNEEELHRIYKYFKQASLIYQRRPCINLGDDGCVNGIIPGSASDGDYLTGGNNPGK